MSLQETIELIQNSKLAAGDKDKIVRLMTLLAKSSREMTGQELQQARCAAGLSPLQAAKLILPLPGHTCHMMMSMIERAESPAGTAPGIIMCIPWPVDEREHFIREIDRIYGLGENLERVDPPSPVLQKIATLEDAIGKIVRCTDGEVRRLLRFDERGDGIYEVDTGSSDGKRAHWMELGATYRGECKKMFVGGEVLEDYQ